MEKRYLCFNKEDILELFQPIEVKFVDSVQVFISPDSRNVILAPNISAHLYTPFFVNLLKTSCSSADYLKTQLRKPKT